MADKALFEQELKELKDQSMWICEREVFLADRKVNIKTLKQGGT